MVVTAVLAKREDRQEYLSSVHLYKHFHHGLGAMPF